MKKYMDNLIASLLEKETWWVYPIVPLLAMVLGFFAAWIVHTLLKVYHKKSPDIFKEQLLKHLRRPVFWLMPLLFLRFSMGYLDLEPFWYKLAEALVIGCVGWMLIGLLLAVEAIVKKKFGLDGDYQASERKVLTQLRFLKSIGMVIITILGISAILWNIPSARQLGNTILTSAGVVGIIVGVAAQKSISNLIVGFQLAFTQTLKIDDEVVIEGEFGNVEDITLTYVVVRTWDWRRLVLPLNYFSEKTFVNWTFNSRPLIASVHLYVDYTLPVDDLRKIMMGILEKDSRWDGDVAELLVTDADNRTMEVRAAFSVRNATDAWELRCRVREELIAYIKTNHPKALPKLRSDTQGLVGA